MGVRTVDAICFYIPTPTWAEERYTRSSTICHLQSAIRPGEERRLPLDCVSHLTGMNLEMQFEMLPFAPSFFRQPAEPMPPPIKEPPSPMENPDAPVREPDPEEPEQI